MEYYIVTRITYTNTQAHGQTDTYNYDTQIHNTQTRQRKTTSLLHRRDEPSIRRTAHLWGFFTPPAVGADLRAALVASCLRGALPPVDLRAVYNM